MRGECQIVFTPLFNLAVNEGIEMEQWLDGDVDQEFVVIFKVEKF